MARGDERVSIEGRGMDEEGRSGHLAILPGYIPLKVKGLGAQFEIDKVVAGSKFFCGLRRGRGATRRMRGRRQVQRREARARQILTSTDQCRQGVETVPGAIGTCQMSGTIGMQPDGLGDFPLHPVTP